MYNSYAAVSYTHLDVYKRQHLSLVYAMSVANFFLSVGIFVNSLFFLVNKSNLNLSLLHIFSSLKVDNSVFSSVSTTLVSNCDFTLIVTTSVLL